jgi:RNA polymerase sigma factor (sigma-70 family)
MSFSSRCDCDQHVPPRPLDQPHTVVVARTTKGWRATFDVTTAFEGIGVTPRNAVRKLYEGAHLEELRRVRLAKTEQERQRKTAYYSENEPYISRLPDDEREAVTMYFGAHRTQSQIGARLHVSQAAVAVKLKRAQERID